MTQSAALSFRKDVSLVGGSKEDVELEFSWGKASLDGVTPGLRATLQILLSGTATEEELVDLMMKADGPSAPVATLHSHLQRFRRLGLLCYNLVIDNQRCVTLVPITPGFQFSIRDIGASTRFRLSRFALCRREGQELVLESPLSHARVIISAPVFGALIARLAQPLAYPELCIGGHELTEESVQMFLSLLVSAAMVAEASEDGTLPEDRNPALVQWELHDLLFHFRSRIGRHDYPVGGTFPFLGKISPLPAVKPKPSGDAIALYKPDLERLEADDIPFTYVLENRKSIRDFGEQSITAQQVGEFLYRTTRVREIIEADLGKGLYYQSSNRPYPSGGATYDLELYLTINTCTEIPSGIYHYDPLDHHLCKLTERNAYVEALLRGAQHSAALSCLPQVLIVLASRFQRLSWKYRSIAYATTLKNVGVLYQTMYLVATAMGLAPCALGSGNSALFAQAIGTNYFVESSVGEFVLGSRSDAK